MEEQAQNLDIESLLSKTDMDNLIELLGQNSVSLGGGNKKKKNTMTPQAKNYLLNQLSSHQKIQEVQKPFKDMDLEEKKTYRNELKERLHNKQNMFKQQRTNHNLLKKSMDAKIKKTTDDVKNTTEIDGQEEQIPKLEEVGETPEKHETQEKQETQETQGESLEDFVN
jgi:hypothetical protein